MRGAQYFRHPRLSFAAVDGEVAYWRKFGLGREAPWVRASVRGAVEDYRDNTRDSSVLDLRLEVGRRFSERLDGAIGYLHDRRFARYDTVLVPGISGAVWDVRAIRVTRGSAMRHRAMAARRRLRMAPRRRGVHDAPEPTIFLASDAIGPTSAFGPDFFDYRLPGTTQVGNLGASYALDDRSSLTSATRTHSRAQRRASNTGTTW